MQRMSKLSLLPFSITQCPDVLLARVSGQQRAHRLVIYGDALHHALCVPSAGGRVGHVVAFFAAVRACLRSSAFLPI